MARIAFGGFEIGAFQPDEIVLTGSNAVAYTTTPADLHRDLAGNGGNRALRGDGTAGGAGTAYRQIPSRYPIVEGWYRFSVCPFFVLNIGGAGAGPRMLLTQGVQTQIEVIFVSDASLPDVGVIKVYRGRNGAAGSALIGTSVAGLFAFDRYLNVEIHVRIHPTTGFVRIYVDDPGTYTTPTYAVNNVNTQFSATRELNSIGWGGRFNLTLFDDWCINSISLAATGITGTFQQGEIITGGTSGASATFYSRQNGSLVLELWNGIAFSDGEIVTGDTSGATATVFAPNPAYAFGLEPQSWAPGEGFTVLRTPTGAGETSDWSNSGATAPSTNWTYVNTVPPNTATFLTTTTPGAQELYTKAPLPSSAFTINGVLTYVYGSRDGAGLPYIIPVLNIGLTDYPGIDNLLPTNTGGVFSPWLLSPASGIQFTVSEINALQFGFRSGT
jgi:hypothetical protein